MKHWRSWCLLVTSVVVSLAPGQAAKGPVKQSAELKVEGARSRFEYVAVAEPADGTVAAIGAAWNFGSPNTALVVEAPLRTEDGMLPPGRYGVTLLHLDANAWALRLANVPRHLDGGSLPGSDVQVSLVHAPLLPKAARLDARWSQGRPQKDGGIPVSLDLRIGGDAFTLRGITWTGSDRSSAGWTATAWPLPAELITTLGTAGVPAPLLTLRHADGMDPTRVRVFNLLVQGDQIGCCTASEGPGQDGSAAAPVSVDQYAVTNWSELKEKDRTPSVAMPTIDIRATQGLYFKLNLAARTTTFCVREPDFGKRKR